jgi:hypothetical protein
LRKISAHRERRGAYPPHGERPSLGLNVQVRRAARG